jgi:hypothetical protein
MVLPRPRSGPRSATGWLTRPAAGWCGRFGPQGLDGTTLAAQREGKAYRDSDAAVPGPGALRRPGPPGPGR